MSGTPAGEDIDVDADPLDLTSLDSESLFKALTAVEKAIPDLLLSVKPILASLSTQTSPEEEEDMGVKAREGIETYMTLLDKIQFVLRQTVYYLHETKAPLTTLQPANPFSLPTPFASSLPASSTNPSRTSSASAGDETKAELGLYGSRLELRVLDDMVTSLQALRRKQEESNSGDS